MTIMLTAKKQKQLENVINLANNEKKDENSNQPTNKVHRTRKKVSYT